MVSLKASAAASVSSMAAQQGRGSEVAANKVEANKVVEYLKHKGHLFDGSQPLLGNEEETLTKLSTGYAGLDQALGGGFRTGQLHEIQAAQTFIGESRILRGPLAYADEQQCPVFWVNPPAVPSLNGMRYFCQQGVPLVNPCLGNPCPSNPYAVNPCPGNPCPDNSYPENTYPENLYPGASHPDNPCPATQTTSNAKACRACPNSGQPQLQQAPQYYLHGLEAREVQWSVSQILQSVEPAVLLIWHPQPDVQMVRSWQRAIQKVPTACALVFCELMPQEARAYQTRLRLNMNANQVSFEVLKRPGGWPTKTEPEAMVVSHI